MRSRDLILCAAPVAALLFAPLAIGQSAPAAPPPPPPAQPPATIVATVVGLRNNTGVLDFGLYRAEHWLQDRGRLVRCRVRISNRTATCNITPPGPGTYAIAFAHDENGNGRTDQGFLGIPTEGYGFSNDVRPRLSAPDFEPCRFVFRGATMAVRMTAQY